MRQNLGLWFKAMRIRGDSDDIVVRQYSDGHKVEFKFPHADTDGPGGLRKIFSDQGFVDIQLSSLGKSAEFSFAKKIFSLSAVLRAMTSPGTKWKIREEPLAEHLFFEMHFTESETQEFTQKSKLNALNGNALLVWHLNRIFSQWTANPEQSGVWLIPVSLRKKSDPVAYGNYASYFLFLASRELTPKQLSERFIDELKSGKYWGTFWILSLLSRFGMPVVKYLSDRNAAKGEFMGTFSDFGNWNYTSPNRADTSQAWVAAPPASRQYPVGIAKLIVNGRLTLGVRIHPKIQVPHYTQIESELHIMKKALLESFL